MNTTTTLVAGALLGLAVGSLLVPITRRELAAAVSRSASFARDATDAPDTPTTPRISRGHWITLALASGLLPAYVLHRVGWSLNALPPLLLLVGLVQLAYCDLKRRLLPKTLVYALSVAVLGSAAVIALWTGEGERLVQATLGGAISFALFFSVNLMNPRWMAFGDVRLSLVFGFGLAWVSPIDLFEAFLFANLLALITGLVLIASRRADRRSSLPFGLFMGLGAALVLIT
jgi:prepilin signal peptidase PulO-like enzyme (type II secretory pathway)